MPPAALPAISRLLPGIVASLWRRPASDLPAAGWSGEFACPIEMAAVARYRQFFASSAAHIPLLYFYALAQRAQVALMLDRRFPYAIPGLVHVRNALFRLDEALPDQPLTLAVRLFPERLADGRQDVAFRVELAQGGRPVAACDSRYRLPRRRRAGPPVQREPDRLPEVWQRTDWRYDISAIRGYARLSGDYNPLHLSSLVARACGFPRAIAHGMYSVGLAAAHIERAASRPLAAIDVAFHQPIPLPAEAVFGCGAEDDGQGAFGVYLPVAGRLALDGRWTLGRRP